jgi:hypothetical protein
VPFVTDAQEVVPFGDSCHCCVTPIAEDTVAETVATELEQTLTEAFAKVGVTGVPEQLIGDQENVKPLAGRTVLSVVIAAVFAPPLVVADHEVVEVLFRKDVFNDPRRPT